MSPEEAVVEVPIEVVRCELLGEDAIELLLDNEDVTSLEPLVCFGVMFCTCVLYVASVPGLVIAPMKVLELLVFVELTCVGLKLRDVSSGKGVQASASGKLHRPL